MQLVVPPTNQETSDSAKLVLLAEDDADTRELLVHVLRDAGYAVVEAAHGLELMSFLSACAVEEARPPDFIVSDIRMPFFSGLEALRSSQRTHIAAPVILITAFCDGNTIARAIHGGASALLEKPIDPARLLATLDALSVEKEDLSCY